MAGTADADPLIGSMLGKNYRVLELIGVGGMAVVYLVEHQTLLKRFAAKVLRPEHASSAEARARFTQEAHAASQLDHENIVGITDFGVTPDERPYFVMELLRGQTLADRLDEGPMTLEEVVAVCVPAARALAHAHAEGIVHRDVKPENIMLVQRSQGRWSVKVLDFGIAKVEANDHLTKTGQTIGSPMYMSPEACRGDDVDMRADVYSFGIVLYLMFAGRVPFDHDNLLEILQMHVSSPVPPPTTFAPELPPAIEAVILKALAKNVCDRYANMEELLVALEEALPDGADVLLLQAQFGAGATPFPGSLERVRAAHASGNFGVHTTGRHDVPVKEQPAVPSPPRRRGWVLALGALVALGGAGAGGYLYLERREAPAVGAANGEPASTGTQPSPASEAATAARVEPTTNEAAPTPPSNEAVPTTNEAVPSDQAPTANEAVPADPAPTANEPAPTNVADQASADVAKPEPARAERKRQPPRTVRTAAAPRAKKPPPPPTARAASATPSVPAAPPSATASAMSTTTPLAAAVKTERAAAVAPPISEQPPAPATAPKPNAGSLDAMPAIATLGVEGSLPSSIVRRSVERVLPSLQACYRTAAKAKNATPQTNVKVRFEIDETGAARRVAASGNFGSLAECVRASMSRVQSAHAPDVGTVSVTVAIQFTPT